METYNNHILKVGLGKYTQLIFGLTLSFISILLLIATIYAFFLYRDAILLLSCFPIGIAFFIGVIFLFLYPVKIVIERNALRCFFVYGERLISWNNISWVKKMFPRISFKGDEALLWVVIKTKGYIFPANYCIFRIHGKGFGLRGKDYITELDREIGAVVHAH